ncbi:MAG TPA: peptidoglycan DD-metalloendopeptidase family protein [Bacteroidia bacterium]|nr:peptidoglycan DD-metalloendopeptidase family protein [Bacteroidia bacterium]
MFLALLLVATPLGFAQAKKKKKSSKPKVVKQDKSDLELKKKNLQTQIDLTDKLLKETRRSKTLSLGQLLALNKKIEAREALMAEINSEIASLDSQIAENNSYVTELDSEIAQLKRDYAKMIVFAYRNEDAYQRMMFLFSADDFNQAFLRMRYIQQIGDGRKEQADKIRDRQQELNDEIRALEQQRQDKQQLLGNQQDEKDSLAQEKEDKDKTFRTLQTKETQLNDDLQKKKTEKANIDSAIQKLIAEEAQRAAAAAAAAAKNNPPKNNTGDKGASNPKSNTPASADKTPPLTPDAVKLGNSFAGSQGQLPWPVAQGTITSHFGKQPHAVLKDVYVYNNGIDISTTEGANARAVFDGEVTGVTNIPGSGWLVIVRHGEYLTVYAKLEEVFVKLGDKVKTKENIGKVSTDTDSGETILHFEVWKGVGKLDPEAWLAKGN